MDAKTRHGLRLGALLLVIVLAACTHGPAIDWQHPSRNHDSRVQFIVVHATEIDFPTSLRVLPQGDVSSHYLVDRDGHIYGLVPEHQRAWHAGPSYWQGTTPLNPSSIGIEIVSVPLGMPEGTQLPFPDLQIRAVERLIADIAERHQVRPDRIVGHGEIQPTGRTDPGRLFPWQQLAESGLVPAPDSATVDKFSRLFAAGLPSVQWAQDKLSEHGYRVPCSGVLDDDTTHVLEVFQGRYRQAQVNGYPDLETMAILAALTTPDGTRLSDGHGHWRPFTANRPAHPHCHQD